MKATFVPLKLFDETIAPTKARAIALLPGLVPFCDDRIALLLGGE
jgi:hypothetical protein